MRSRLGISQSQRIALAPGLWQTLAVLRLPTADLLDLIVREAADNPFLLVEEAPHPRGVVSAIDVALDTTAAETSVLHQLFLQISAMTLPEDIRALVLHLVGELREDGYLDARLSKIAEDTGQPLQAVEAALAVLQSCEPAGIGARSLVECLELQLRDRGLDEPLARKVVARLDSFAAADLRDLERQLGLPRPRLEEIADMIRGLRPRPIPQAECPEQPLLPDLVLERDGEELHVRPGRGFLPYVQLNPDLANPNGQSFGAEARLRAEALIQALAYRGETLRRIGTWLARHQRRALLDGPEQMVPLTRAALARDLGLHPSTIGRAVAGKAMEFEGRLWPLSRFFSRALPAGDAEVSAVAVQQAIARIVAAEPPAAPLSDEEIARRLVAEGVDISRRTVAKYRGCLRIPPSHRRRRRRDPIREKPPRASGKGAATH